MSRKEKLLSSTLLVVACILGCYLVFGVIFPVVESMHNRPTYKQDVIMHN